MLSLTMTLKEADTALSKQEYADCLNASKKAMVTYSSLSVTDRFNNTDSLRKIIELRCDSNAGLGDMQEALDDASELCRQFNNNAEAFFKLGDLARRVKHFSEAKSYLEHALLINEHLTRAKIMLKSIQTDISINAPIPEKFRSVRIPSISAFERGEKAPEATKREQAKADAEEKQSPKKKSKKSKAVVSSSDEDEEEDAADEEENDEDSSSDQYSDEGELNEDGQAQFSLKEKARMCKAKPDRKPFLTSKDAPHWVIYPLILLIFASCFLSIKTFVAAVFVYYLHNYLEVKEGIDIFRINGVPLSTFTGAILVASFLPMNNVFAIFE